ncbi:MAG: hypothetical protein HY830_15070 [Actinobacteria bacterium]|nr:hypothetical protein [Actinomycetota bacterium]
MPEPKTRNSSSAGPSRPATAARWVAVARSASALPRRSIRSPAACSARPNAVSTLPADAVTAPSRPAASEPVVASVTPACASRATSAARSSPYRSAKTSPWDCPWSERTTNRYGRGATAATFSSWARTASMPASASSDYGRSIPAWWATAS